MFRLWMLGVERKLKHTKRAQIDTKIKRFHSSYGDIKPNILKGYNKNTFSIVLPLFTLWLVWN